MRQSTYPFTIFNELPLFCIHVCVLNLNRDCGQSLLKCCTRTFSKDKPTILFIRINLPEAYKLKSALYAIKVLCVYY